MHLLIVKGFIPIALGLIQAASPTEEVEGLIEQLRTLNLLERIKVKEQIKSRGGTAVEPLRASLAGKSQRLIHHVNQSLPELSSSHWRDRDAAMERLAGLGLPALPHLKGRPDEDPEVRWRIHLVIQQIEQDRPRQEALEEHQRAAICELLGELRASEAIPDLLHSTEHVSESVRSAAVLSLGMLKAREAVPCLAALLHHDPRWSVRAHAARSLGEITGLEAAETLLQRLRAPSEDNLRVRQMVILSLGQINTPETTRELISVLERPDPAGYSHLWAVEALRRHPELDLEDPPRGDETKWQPYINRCRHWWETTWGRPWE